MTYATVYLLVHGYQRGLVSMVYKLFDKKSALLYKSSGSRTINEPSYQLANELHNSITKKLKKKSLFIFRDNI